MSVKGFYVGDAVQKYDYTALENKPDETIEKIENNLKKNNCYNILDDIGHYTDGTSRGVSFTWDINTKSCTVTGTSTGDSGNTIVGVIDLPDFFVPGEKYYANFNSTDTNILVQIFYYESGRTGSDHFDGITKSSPFDFTIPNNAARILIRLKARQNATVDGVISNICISRGPSNIKLYDQISATNSALAEVSALPSGGTAGQVLKKIDSADGNATWATMTIPTSYNGTPVAISSAAAAPGSSTSWARGDHRHAIQAGSIPKTALQTAVQSSLNKADTAYQKPVGGIPKTDLDAIVQIQLLPSGGDEGFILKKHSSTDHDVRWVEDSGRVFVATYGSTTNAELQAAYDAGKLCFVNYGGKNYLLSARDTLVEQTLGGPEELVEIFQFTTIDNMSSEKISLRNDKWLRTTIPLAKTESPTLTGIPKAPTADAGTNTIQIATTAFVQTAISEKADTSAVGSLANLTTTNKSSIVSAVNEVNSKAIPSGGLTGQILKKNSDTDFDMNWAEDMGTYKAYTVAANQSGTLTLPEDMPTPSEIQVDWATNKIETIIRLRNMGYIPSVSGTVGSDRTWCELRYSHRTTFSPKLALFTAIVNIPESDELICVWLKGIEDDKQGVGSTTWTIGKQKIAGNTIWSTSEIPMVTKPGIETLYIFTIDQLTGQGLFPVVGDLIINSNADFYQVTTINASTVETVAIKNTGTLPSGGTTGQFLRKKSNTNYDVEWAQSVGDTTIYHALVDKSDGSIAYIDATPALINNDLDAGKAVFMLLSIREQLHTIGGLNSPTYIDKRVLSFNFQDFPNSYTFTDGAVSIHTIPSGWVYEEIEEDSDIIIMDFVNENGVITGPSEDDFSTTNLDGKVVFARINEEVTVTNPTRLYRSKTYLPLINVRDDEVYWLPQHDYVFGGMISPITYCWYYMDKTENGGDGWHTQSLCPWVEDTNWITEEIIGDLSNLTTTDKTSIVNAINELNTRLSAIE